MRKNPFLIFAIVITILTVSVVAYIQSGLFARTVKRVASRYLPTNLGIDGDFANLSVGLFPPSIGVVSPRIDAQPENVAGLPPGTHVEAERIELTFRPFQMLSGRVSVHEVRVVNGLVRTSLAANPTPKKPKKIRLSWQDLIEIRAEGVSLENTRVELDMPGAQAKATFNAKRVEIAQAEVKRKTGYDLFVQLEGVRLETRKAWPYPDALDSLRVSAHLDSNGLTLKGFELTREGTQLLAQGRVNGDVLKGQGLTADVELKLRGDLRPALQFVVRGKRDAESSLPDGHAAFDGRVTANLDRPAETLSASGVLVGENVKYGAYGADQVEIEGAYSAGSGTIAVKRASVLSREIEKKGGEQPGAGGKIEIGAFTLALDDPKPIQTQVQFTRAHLHWLAAIAIKDIYLLDGRVTGKTIVKYQPSVGKAPWTLAAGVDWTFDKIQLDNQRMGKTKPLSRLISIPQPRLVGTINVGPQSVSFQDTKIGLKTTQLEVSGAVHYGGERITYDILGGGPVDLSEMGLLAENKIRGTGALSVHVHGPSDRVELDFDGDLKNFYYLRMPFGEFRGRLTYDDGTSQLLFRNLDCSQARTRYRVDGAITFGDKKDTIDLTANVPPGGNIHDFLHIFSELTSELWWYPAAMNGNMSGSMRLTGGLALDEMTVAANIQGDGWEYLGERFRKVDLVGGYDKGRYFISNVAATKRSGILTGQVSFDSRNQQMEWKLDTEKFQLSDIDRIARVNVPIRGALEAHSQGKGLAGFTESETTIAIDDVKIRGVASAPSVLSIRSKGGKIQLAGTAFGESGKVEALYDSNLGGASFIKASAKNFDFSPMVLILNPSLMQDRELRGEVTGSYELNFTSGKMELGSGTARISEYLLAKTGRRFSLEKPVEVRIDRGSFSIPAINLVSDQGTATLSMDADNGKLDGRIHGKIGLGIAEFLTSAVSSAEGTIQPDLRIRGTLKEPELVGGGTIRDGVVRIPALDTPFENIQGRFDIQKWNLQLREVESDLAGGRVTLSGSLQFFIDSFPRLDLSANLSGNKIRVYPFQVAKVRGKLAVKGETRPYLVTGKVFVENALAREKLANSGGGGLRSAQYTPPATSSNQGEISLFRLDIDVSAPGNIIVQNEIMNLEAKGDLKIVGTLENPRPMGTARAVQGQITFKDRAFQIQSGFMEFDNPAAINPRFETVAVTEVSNRKIQLFASGRLDKYRIEFTSNPAMAETEILSLLALGSTAEDMRRYRGGDRSTYEQGEAASLVLHSLDFNREVQNKTGFEIELDQAVDDTAGTSIFRPRSDADSAVAPKIVIKRQLGKRVGLSVGSTVGVGTSIQRQVNAEVRVTPTFSVLGVWDSFEGANTDETKRNSYGVDLKLQKRFK